ncbi:hypothetical protein EDD15DRAFT_2521221 [Pisolithus albus]|nr:hypothetical protein EDD15DRAFT_2521221 [Pisolithus albus]
MRHGKRRACHLPGSVACGCVFVIRTVHLKHGQTRANAHFSSIIVLVEISVGPIPSYPLCMCNLVRVSFFECSSFVHKPLHVFVSRLT